MTARMRRHVSLLLPLAVLALAAVALPHAAADPQAGASATKRVRVGDFFFRKRAITIQSGDRVRWVWVGSEPHDVTVTRGPRKFHSRTKRDGSYRKRLRARGTYRYICSVHPIDMRGKVVVK
jgi:plastocyanin